jgi:NAD-dependent DNA ligase
MLDEQHSVDFQVDGVVAYTYAGVKGFKFYYTEFQDTIVEEIQWNRKENGSFAPVLAIKTIELNGKEINNVATGGVPNMIDSQMGKGAKVRVILANMTIPKVIEVLEPSEDYQFPTCDCGYQLSENDIYGSTLKCQNENGCKWKVNNWYSQFIREILETPDCIDKDVISFFRIELWWILSYLKIDRWNPQQKFQGENEGDLACQIWANIDDNQPEEFKYLIESNFYFTELNAANFEINWKSTFELLKRFVTNYDRIRNRVKILYKK